MHQQYQTMLEAAAFDIVTLLGGSWRSGGAMCRCPAHDDKTPSLSVRVGDKSLLFKCFAGCPVRDVLREIRRLQFAVPVLPRGLASPVVRTGQQTNTALALQIWERAQSILGTFGERYLIGRGLNPAGLPLRFHPRTPVGSGPAVQFRPAIIAPLCDERGLNAIQRIFLDPQSASLARDLEAPKLTLGRPLGAAVRLLPATSTLGLAEGVETAAAAMILLQIPVWATLGNERLGRISIPDSVEHLILLPDVDRPGLRSAGLAKTGYARPGRTVEIRLPFGRVNDWNDALRLRQIREEEGE